MKLLKVLALLGLSSFAFAGPSQPPAGNYILNVSTIASQSAFRVSSGTIANITITGTCTGAGCGSGGGGGSTGGSIVASTQNNVGYYSASATNTISGASNLTNNGTTVLIYGKTPLISTSTLQSGATFYVSSGTVNGTIYAGNYDFNTGNSYPITSVSALSVACNINGVVTGACNSSSPLIQFSGVANSYLDASGKLSLGAAGPKQLNVIGQAYIGASNLYPANTLTSFEINPSTTTTYALLIATVSRANTGQTIGITTNTEISLNGSVGTNGQVVTSAGPGLTPTWSTLTGAVLASTQTWTGQNNWTTTAQSTFTYGVTAGSITIGGPTATALLSMLTEQAAIGKLQIGLNNFLQNNSVFYSSGPILFSAAQDPANWSAETDMTVSSFGVTVGNLTDSGLGASLSVCTDGSKKLTTSGCTGGGGGGSSTTTVHINGTTLSTAATDFTFISGTGGIIAGSSSTANAVSLTFSVDSVTFLSKITDQAGTDKKCISTTGNTTYTCALNPTLTVYSTGTCVTLFADTSNATSATLNVDTLGAFPVVNSTGGALSAGNITANQPVTMCLDYSNTHWVIQGIGSPSSFVNLNVTSTATIKSLTLGTTDFGTITSSPTVIPNFALGNTMMVVLASSITINGPSNPVDNAKMVFRISQDAVGSRLVIFNTGAGNFAFGTDITSFTATTTASKTDYVGAIYSAAANRWHIVAVTKGF